MDNKDSKTLKEIKSLMERIPQINNRQPQYLNEFHKKTSEAKIAQVLIWNKEKITMEEARCQQARLDLQRKIREANS